MLCDCCLKEINKIFKLGNLKETYEKLLDENGHKNDILLCCWCWKTVNKIDKFRKMVIQMQAALAKSTYFQFDNFYNLQKSVNVNHYDEIFIDEESSETNVIKNEYFHAEQAANENAIVKTEALETNIYDIRKHEIDESNLEKNYHCSKGNHDKLLTNEETQNSTKARKKIKLPYKNSKLITLKKLSNTDEGSVELHSHYILKHNLIASNLPTDGRYKYQLLTDDEILSRIKLTDEKLKCDDVRFKCLLCHQSFRDEQQQNDHISLHQFRPNTVLCKFCNIWINEDRQSVVLHYRGHYVMYNCGRCLYSHSNIKEISSHYTKKHIKYKCQHCDKVFNTRGNKNYHIDKEHNGKTYQCNQCGKLYNTMTTLRSHMVAHTNKIFTCNECGKTFTKSSNYYAHRSTTHKDITPIQCCGCNKMFRFKSHYKKHLEDTCNHQGDRKKYKCSHCDNEYLSNAQLQRHINVAHLGVGITCNICGKLCQTKSNLARHMETHADKTGRTRDYICDHCGKTFYTKPQLKEHLNKHSDDRPRKCKLCNATFKFKASLYTHINCVHKKLKRVKRN